jgi:erythromycin esterase-like protein
MITPNASNWVLRGDSPNPALSRVLSSYLHLDPASASRELQDYTAAVRDMAEADATEVQLAGYLRSLEERHAGEHPASHRRAVAIALWHIAKCAEVRDRALQLLGIKRGAAI